MAICGGCNAETRRVHITMTDERGNLRPEGERKEICPNCCPEFFSAPFAAPSDRKIWDEAAALPHLYHLTPDGNLELSDSPKADLLTKFGRDTDLEAAIAWKRKNRRTTPMTQEEIAQRDAEMRPFVQDYLQRCREAEQSDRDYTEAAIERWLREDHDREKRVQ